MPDESTVLGCKIDAKWRIWLYLHDAAGHTRISNITVFTNDIASDTIPPVAQIDIVEDEVSLELLEFICICEPTVTGDKDSDGNWIMEAVSYTHLTLPTNSRV